MFLPQPLNDIDISIFQPFIQNEYLKDQQHPGANSRSDQRQQQLPLQLPQIQQHQHLQLHNVTFPGQPLGTGTGPPSHSHSHSQFPLSPPISFSDYETLHSATPEECYPSCAGMSFELQPADDDDEEEQEDGSSQQVGCQEESEECSSSTLNASAAVPPVKWSEVVPWISTKPPARGRTRGSKRKAAAAQSGESADATTAAATMAAANNKPGAKRRGRKSRASRQQQQQRIKTLADEDDNEDDKKNAAALDQEAKAAHSVVERRYRDNLNGKMSQLYYVLREVNSPGPHSQLRLSSTTGPTAPAAAAASLPSFQPPTRVRKSEILNSAIDYIHQSEVEMRHMADEIRHLQDKERTIRNLVKCEEWAVLKALMSSG
ncbi:hypothetical protein AYL99_10425 [Fonsecaea erecta]|uniref:BHLH domain-containing protein n=1 Tax=Fonsecaea erecta TaxID=1367422 RepID=A0A178Z6X1_9EURO|nr:hypothetical protein AYL99_10425 [Fonsecaea erecta]OAP55452.1 hypothetical protein AYL99_10425 [Fonsecaea erecta]